MRAMTSHGGKESRQATRLRLLTIVGGIQLKTSRRQAPDQQATSKGSRQQQTFAEVDTLVKPQDKAATLRKTSYPLVALIRT